MLSLNLIQRLFLHLKKWVLPKIQEKMFVNFLKGRNKGSLASLEVASRGS